MTNFIQRITWGTVSVVNYPKVAELISKSLDLGDGYKLFAIDWKFISPDIAEASDSLPSVLISREDATQGTWNQWIIR